MVLRNSGNSPIEIFERLIGKSVDLQRRGSDAWWEADNQDRPKPSLTIRLLQARIAALDPAEDEDILELSHEEAA
jgi:hypothetical protein